MNLRIIPDACLVQKNEAGEDIPPAFSGHIIVELPSFPERCRFPREVGLDAHAGNVTEEKKKEFASTLQDLDFMAKVAEKIKPKIIEVCLHDIKSDEKINSVDDLYAWPDCGTIVADLCMRFLTGFAAKKN
jgi:hypothetical protein